jgi:hypothetical protein
MWISSLLAVLSHDGTRRWWDAGVPLEDRWRRQQTWWARVVRKPDLDPKDDP